MGSKRPVTMKKRWKDNNAKSKAEREKMENSSPVFVTLSAAFVP